MRTLLINWEQVKLSELVTKEKSYSLSRDVETEKETETRYIHYGDIHTGIADKITNKNQLPFIKEDSYEPLLKGDLILADASEDYQGIATPAIILETTKYRIVAGLHTIVLRPSDKCDSLYLYYLLKTKSFKRHGYRMGTGMKVFGITANNVLAFKTLLPSKKEQNKISQLLKIMDRLLTLQQRKHDLLKKLKQGYLQQMFPVKNEVVPQLRFSGFKDDWGQIKFKNIIIRVNKSSNSNKLPKIEFEDISAGEGRLNKDISKKFDTRKGIEFEPNDILYGKLRPYLKNWLMPNFKGIALGDFWIFRSTNNISNFVYNLIQTNKYQKAANDTSGTKMPRSDWKKVSETMFFISKNLEEQQKIGEFFQKLDQDLSLQQLKIEQLQQLKQAYLQKLFP